MFQKHAILRRMNEYKMLLAQANDRIELLEERHSAYFTNVALFNETLAQVIMPYYSVLYTAYLTTRSFFFFKKS